jgi:hypothetical protein
MHASRLQSRPYRPTTGKRCSASRKSIARSASGGRERRTAGFACRVAGLAGIRSGRAAYARDAATGGSRPSA